MLFRSPNWSSTRTRPWTPVSIGPSATSFIEPAIETPIFREISHSSTSGSLRSEARLLRRLRRYSTRPRWCPTCGITAQVPALLFNIGRCHTLGLRTFSRFAPMPSGAFQRLEHFPSREMVPAKPLLNPWRLLAVLTGHESET